MKVLVGVDSAGRYRPALDMVLGLGFPNLEVHLVNCVTSAMVDGSFPDASMTGALAEVYRELEAAGRDDLEAAEQCVKEGGAKSVSKQTFGNITHRLLDYADENGCDLIAVASETKDYLGSLFFGSVAKGLVMGAKQSVLVVKSQEVSGGPVKAVLATDHSEYANNCMDLLMKMAPSGLGEIKVVSAFGAAKSMAPKYQAIMKDASEQERAMVKVNVGKRNQELATKLGALCEKVSEEVVEGRPGPVIDAAMSDTGADLLIMGAQGHGFLDRITMGSVSFHQVVSTKHNVLVLRA